MIQNFPCLKNLTISLPRIDWQLTYRLKNLQKVSVKFPYILPQRSLVDIRLAFLLSNPSLFSVPHYTCADSRYNAFMGAYSQLGSEMLTIMRKYAVHEDMKSFLSTHLLAFKLDEFAGKFVEMISSKLGYVITSFLLKDFNWLPRCLGVPYELKDYVDALMRRLVSESDKVLFFQYTQKISQTINTEAKLTAEQHEAIFEQLLSLPKKQNAFEWLWDTLNTKLAT